MTRPVYSSTICTLPSATIYCDIAPVQMERGERMLHEFLARAPNGPQARQSGGQPSDLAFAAGG